MSTNPGASVTNGTNMEKFGTVKKVLSGDTVIIRDQPKGKYPKELQVNLAYIVAPKVGRKVFKPNENSGQVIPDDAYAWEAREFLRKKIIGKQVVFKYEYKIPLKTTSGEPEQRECGFLCLQDENLCDTMVREGLGEVIRRKANEENEGYKRLVQLEEEAREAHRGKHSGKESSLKREIQYEVEHPEELERKTFPGIVEDVIDGSTMRVFLQIDGNKYQQVTVALAGIRCPTKAEPFYDEAKFITESRLLHRDVEVQLQQAFENQSYKFYGSIYLGKNNISALLLREGLAKIVPHSLSQCPDPAVLRTAEREAKTRKVKLYKDYSDGNQSKAVSYEVVEVVNGDSLKVKNLQTNEVKKIFLASIRPPQRPEGYNEKSKPLYDIPLMFEAREFLRKRLIGKKVQVKEDYTQKAKSEPGKPDLAEKVCCSVFLNDNINIAEALVSKGLASVVKHSHLDENRSSCYEALFDAELKAQKTKRGIHGGSKPPSLRVVELGNELSKAKQFMPFLLRGSSQARMEAVVEYVFSASRVKVFVPKENCLLNLILAGITTPRAGEPFSDEALLFLRSLIHQRDVQITVETMDKVGNFIGHLFFNDRNMSLELLKNGYASLRDSKDNQFIAAEEDAKSKRLNMWKTWNEDEAKEEENDEENAKEQKREEVVITHVSPGLSSVYTQLVENGPRLEELLAELREELTANPPLPGSYHPKKGTYCAAKFSADGLWYRAKIEKIVSSTVNQVIFVDYGNRENVATKDLAPFPSSKFDVTSSSPAPAKEYALAFVKLPSDPDAVQEADAVFTEETRDKVLRLKVEYKDIATGLSCVSLYNKEEDLLLKMVADGYLLANNANRREKRLQATFDAYRNAQDSAKRKRLNIWEYGDFTEDDAKEFGLGK